MSVRLAIEAFKQLEHPDFRILQAIERGMITHQYVEVRIIAKYSGFDEEYTLKRLKRLNSLGLVQRMKRPYIGYILTSRGYDCLAFNALIKRQTLKAITATPLGEGKESEVYMGLTPGERVVAVKIHRVGRTSFRHTKKVRVYVGDKRHISWLYQSRLAAKQEFEALRILYRHEVAVPEPIDWNRHVVVTGFVEGIELFKLPELTEPLEILKKIFEEVRKAYHAGIIHGDLSEYNIMVTRDEEIVIFDWPQWISASHPSAYYYLKRDLTNVVEFFRRKYLLKIDTDRFVEEFLNSIGKLG